MTDDVDPLLAGRGALSYEQLDAAAHRLHDLLTETAEHQITRPLTHEFDIAVDTAGSRDLDPPPGYRRPAAGSITTRVEARARSSAPAVVEVRVTVWPALGGADVTDLLVERQGTDHRLEVRIDEVHPEPTDALRGRVNDFVARQTALVVTELNVLMQRALGNPDWDVAEHTDD